MLERVYYSLNRAALNDLNTALGAFFHPARIQPRRLTCGPQALIYALDLAVIEK